MRFVFPAPKAKGAGHIKQSCSASQFSSKTTKKGTIVNQKIGYEKKKKDKPVPRTYQERLTRNLAAWTDEESEKVERVNHE